MPDHFRGGQPLKNVFFGDNLFNIPEFQRDFAWTETEISDLLRDFGLSPAVPPSARNPQQWSSFYFLGQIVLLRDDEDATGHIQEPVSEVDPPVRPKPGSPADVVDGQQRLTTLTILMCCLRDRIDDADVRQQLHGMVAAPTAQLTAHITSATPATPILDVGRGPEGAYFMENVQSIGATSKAEDDSADFRDDDAPLRRLKQARRQIAKAVLALSMSERLALAEFLRERCLMSIVITANRETGWDVFSRLNKRGRPLLESERLKSDILRDVPEPQRAGLVKLWDHRKRLLGAAFDAGDARRKDLFSYIRDGYAPKSGRRTEDRILTLAQTMGSERFMAEVFEPTSRALAEVTLRQTITDDGAVHQLDASFIRTLALLELAGATISANTAEAQDGWKAPVLLFFAKAGNDTGLKRAFARNYDRFLHILLVLHGKRKKPNISKQIAKLTHCIQTEGASLNFKNAFQVPNLKQVENNLVTALDGSVAKLILLRVSCEKEGLDVETAAQYLSASYNIEHVLPEKVTDNWRKMAGGDEQAKKMRGNIGNLFLTGQRLNSKLGNRTWEEKKRLLRHAKVLLPFGDDLRDATRWDTAAILARQHKIVAAINQLWSLSGTPWDSSRVGGGTEQSGEARQGTTTEKTLTSGTKLKHRAKVKPVGPQAINRPRRDYPPRIRAKRRGATLAT
ncbi:MAG: DUF262 domain-containing HNH endonuclease family protein [Pseudomonadota bacterium]